MNSHSFDLWQAIASASLVVQVTLVILLILSIWTWTIIIYKWLWLRRFSRSQMEFLNRVQRVRTWDGFLELVFEKESEEFLARAIVAQQKEDMESNNPSVWRDQLKSSEYKERLLNQLTLELEKGLTFLATVGSNAPFIGLFGTVWGILHAFGRIGSSGQAQLAVVAPAIAEALFATAVGLAVAIPATIGYNFFIAKVRHYQMGFEEAWQKLSEKISELS